MMSITAFRSLSSPLVWLQLIGVTFPDPALAIIAAASGAPATPEILAEWNALNDRGFFAGLLGRGGPAYPSVPPKLVLLLAGRDAFKSTKAVILGIDRLLHYDATPFVADGSEVCALVVAPSKKQSAGIVRNCVGLAEKVAALLGGHVEQRGLAGDAEIVFRIPGLGYTPILRISAADEATLRGGAYVYCAWSEAGWFPSGPDQNTLADLRAAVVPRGAGQFPFFLELAESTCGPPSGWFYDSCERPPRGALKIGPLATPRINPAFDADAVRALMGEEAYRQEILCESWGLLDAAFIPTTSALGCVDADGGWTSRGVVAALGSVVAVDVANKGGRDEIAFVAGHPIEVEEEPGRVVRRLVCPFLEYWRPAAGTTITTAAIFDHAARISARLGGVPLVADNRGFVDGAEHVRRSHGFQIIEGDADERTRAVVERGGKIVVERGMDARSQTARWTRLKDLVATGRLHLPNDDAGREAARELGNLRATQMSSGLLRVEGASGQQDGLADCLSLLAQFVDLLPANRRGGYSSRLVVESTNFSRENGIEVSSQWRRVDEHGRDCGPGEPPIDHPTFAAHFVEQVSKGALTNACEAFARTRLGLSANEPVTMMELQRLVEDLARNGEVEPRGPSFSWTAAAAEEDFATALRRKARNRPF